LDRSGQKLAKRLGCAATSHWRLLERIRLRVRERRWPRGFGLSLALGPRQSPCRWWWNCDTEALRQLLAQIDPKRVAALAISNQRETFAQFDRGGTPLRPGTTWLDSRAVTEVAELSPRLAPTAFTGFRESRPTGALSLSLRWFERHMPDLWTKMSVTAEVHGFLAFKLTGQWVTSTASADPWASRFEKGDWSDELLDAVDLPREKLPQLVRPGQMMGRSRAMLHVRRPSRWNAVIAGGGDGQCAGTGTNVFERGRAISTWARRSSREISARTIATTLRSAP